MQDPRKLIDRIIDLRVSEDGERVTLLMKDRTAGEAVLDLPFSQTARLVALASRALADRNRVHAAFGPRARVDITWWNLQQNGSEGFLLSQTFGAGGSLSFDLSPHVASALLSVLNVLLCDPTESPTLRAGFVE